MEKGKHYDPPGVEFYSAVLGKQMKYVYPDTPNPCAGWILYKHPDGQWVTYRKATDADIEEMSAAIIKAHHVPSPERGFLDRQNSRRLDKERGKP